MTTWQFAPGEDADHWDEFHAEGIIAISFSANVGDLRRYSSREDLAERIGADDAKNSALQLEYFRDAEVGDLVVAKRGLKVVVGVGVIEGPYEYHGSRKLFWHVRKTRWIVSRELRFDDRIFTRGAFLRTLRWTEIRENLLEAHPEHEKDLEQIESLRTESGQQAPARSLRGLRTALSRAIQREWVKPITGLLPAIDAALKEVGGPVRDKVNPAGEPYSRQRLRESCTAALGKVDTMHPVVPHIRTILRLSDDSAEPPSQIVPTAQSQDEPSHQVVYTREQALQESGLGESTFEEYWQLLLDKRQIVFQGPPGTGKTYLAEIYGRLLVAGDMQRLEVVQFHPSYSYEDFVEGYRPTMGGGLEVREGIFKLICGKARKSDDATVLIIDEINRGDLSKIFGELLYLLEYRGKKIKLTHNPRLSFEIPENLYLIGTMNTADRSLALIDYALRRRFSFISLEPQYDLVKRLVTSYEVDIDLLINNFRLPDLSQNQVTLLAADRRPTRRRA